MSEEKITNLIAQNKFLEALQAMQAEINLQKKISSKLEEQVQCINQQLQIA